MKLVKNHLFKNFTTNRKGGMSPLLKMEVTCASFYVSGYMAVDKILLKIILRGNTTDSSHNRSMWGRYPIGTSSLVGI